MITDHRDTELGRIVASTISRDGAYNKAEWVEEISNGPRACVSRFQITRPIGSILQTVVVKQHRARKGESFDSSANQGHAWRLFNEWSALEFLRGAFESPLLYPKFLGGNVEQGLLVLEDLGDKCLSKLLFLDDPGHAESYLTDLVRILGRLHAQTCKRGEEYRSIREELGPTDRHFLSVVEPPDTHSDISKRLCAWLAAICDAFDVEPCKEWASDIELIAASVDKPGPYECLTHGDFCPGNDLLVGGQLRFIDFEISSFRHALIDGPADPSIFHRAGRGEAIPFEVQLKLRDAYREELAKGCPEAGDDASFYEEVTRICVYRCLFQLKSVLREDILTRNDRWGSTTDWQRIFKALDSVVWTTESYSGIEAIGKTAERIREKLRKTWPHTAQVSPPFPAFA